MIIEFLIRKWPDIFGETPEQRQRNIAAGGMKPSWMSWDEWRDHSRSGYFGRECHWYDPPDPESPGRSGHCRGDLEHDHQPRIMKWYWASPLGFIVPFVYFLWESGSFGLSMSLTAGGARNDERKSDDV